MWAGAGVAEPAGRAGGLNLPCEGGGGGAGEDTRAAEPAVGGQGWLLGWGAAPVYVLGWPELCSAVCGRGGLGMCCVVVEGWHFAVTAVRRCAACIMLF